MCVFPDRRRVWQVPTKVVLVFPRWTDLLTATTTRILRYTCDYTVAEKGTLWSSTVTKERPLNNTNLTIIKWVQESEEHPSTMVSKTCVKYGDKHVATFTKLLFMLRRDPLESEQESPYFGIFKLRKLDKHCSHGSSSLWRVGNKPALTLMYQQDGWLS